MRNPASVATGAPEMELVVARSISEFSPAEWNRLFPGELEDGSYYLAVERARLPGFEWLYFGVRVGGELRAAVPAFVAEYRLDTTLEGGLRRVVSSLSRAVPALLCPRVLSLGSPVAEACHMGFAVGSGPAERQRMFELILDACDRHARRHGARMLAIKDASDGQSGSLREPIAARGMRRQPGLANATLALPFESFDDYLASLSRATRKDLRRKLRKRKELRIEWRRDVQGLRDDVLRLYRNTLQRAPMHFEELTADYFEQVLAGLGERAWCVCYWLGGTLVAFNLVLVDDGRLLDKYIGMDYRHAREFNLYYLSWMENVRHAIERRIPVYQSGQGLPEEKLRLGSTLSQNWLWYRHRNRLIDGTMRAAERALGLHHSEALDLLPRRTRA
jgi:hypothetical protein